MAILDTCELVDTGLFHAGPELLTCIPDSPVGIADKAHRPRGGKVSPSISSEIYYSHFFTRFGSLSAIGGQSGLRIGVIWSVLCGVVPGEATVPGK